MKPSRDQVVPFDFVDQRSTRDAKLDSCSGPIPSVVLQRALDVLALEIFQAQRSVAAVAHAGSGPELTGQVLDADGGLASTKDQGTLQHIAHFTHVAGPWVRQQAVQDLTG